MQSLHAGTFEEVFGPGKTPSWALPTDVIKYQRDQLITNEVGLNLQNTVSVHDDAPVDFVPHVPSSA